MSRYRILESVGTRVERVHDYDDLEIHHPSKRGREPGRTYASIDGEREEVLKTRTRNGERMVSKDFVLQDERGSARVPVPSPVDGYVGRVDRANGLVAIYDRKDGELLVQIRHMDLRSSAVKVGETVHYGEALGVQSGFGKGNPRKYGVHVHMDFNEAHLDRFDRYLKDMDGGVLTPAGLPKDSDRPTHRPVTSRASGSPGILEEGSQGEAVERLQRMLTRLGYHDASGRAWEAFQRDRGLDVDGRVGRDTTAALAKATERLVSEPSHPRHGLYQQAVDALTRLEQSHGLPTGAHSERIAGAMCVCAVQAGLARIDRVELNQDRSLVRAVEVSAVRDEPGLNRATVPMSTVAAIGQTLASSSERLAQVPSQTMHDTLQERRPVALTM
jgi:hypothetical protein